MAVPPLTPEQRSAALAKAAQVRRERALLKARLKYTECSLAAILEEGKTNDVIGKMKVSTLLESLPGVGRIRAKKIMEDFGIASSRRVRGLGVHQTAALVDKFEFTGIVGP